MAPVSVSLLLAASAMTLLVACGVSPSSRPSASAVPPPTQVAHSPGTPAASSPSASYPLTVTDGTGRLVRLEHAPQRIVSYMPSNTETLFALGAGDQIVGTDTFSDYPSAAQGKPKLGGVQVNLEALVALQPDLVVTIGLKPDFPTLLAPQGIPVIVLAYNNIEGTLANVELLGQVVGQPAAARQLVATMRAHMEAVQARSRAAPQVRVYYELDATDPANPYTAGPGSFVHDLLGMAGGQNIAAETTGQFPRISAEAVVRADPQVIVVAVGPYSPPDAADPARFAQRPGWQSIDAVRRGAVRMVDASLLSRPGPRLVDGLDALAAAVHPELFGRSAG